MPRRRKSKRNGKNTRKPAVKEHDAIRTDATASNVSDEQGRGHGKEKSTASVDRAENHLKRGDSDERYRRSKRLQESTKRTIVSAAPSNTTAATSFDVSSSDENASGHDSKPTARKNMKLSQEQSARKKRVRNTKKNQLRTVRKTKKKYLSDSSTSDEVRTDDSSVEDSKPKRQSPSRASARKAVRKMNEYDEGSNEESEDSDVNRVVHPERKQEDDNFLDSEESSESDIAHKSTKKQTPSQTSGRLRKRKILNDTESESEESGNTVDYYPKLKRKKDDDEDFLDTEAEEDDSEDESVSNDEQLEENSETSSHRPVVGKVSDKDFGNDVESSDEETLPKSGTLIGGEGHGHDNEESEIHPLVTLREARNTDDESVESREEKGATSPKRFFCPSQTDVITADPLPEKHVCYFAPDGQSRQCFALETLRKIALTTAHPKFRKNLAGESKQTFLQPPHFRSIMSDDLLDQIASRFGRDALDLFGSYYLDKSATSNEMNSFAQHSNHEEDAHFHELVDEYVQNCMGSQDIYACPLCYTVAHQRLDNPSSTAPRASRRIRSESGDLIQKTRQKYAVTDKYDPMSVLGSLDSEHYEIASMFCFKKLSALKGHLRTDHKVDTRIVAGNDLYSRFKIRNQDGLLQRFLSRPQKIGSRGRVSDHGQMMRYWNQGYSFNFVHLLTLISDAERYRRTLDQAEEPGDDDSDIVSQRIEATAFIQPAIEFFHSFAGEVEALWTLLSDPFRKATKHEMDDFIDDRDGEPDDGSTFDARAKQRQLDIDAFRESAEEDRLLAAYYEDRDKELRQKARQAADHSDNSRASYDEDESLGDHSSAQSSVGSQSDLQEESAESEDQWEQKIKSKKRRSIMNPKLRRRSGENDSSESEDLKVATTSSQGAKVLWDSDDE